MLVAPADEASTLPALLIAPADPVRTGAANRALERLDIPWRLGAPKRGESVVRGATGVGGGADSLAGVSVRLRYALSALPGARSDTLATTAGQPWIVSGPRYVLIASPLDPAATTFPVRAAFVPWLGDVFSQRLSEEPGRVVHAAPGGVAARPPDVDALELPGGAASAGRASLPLRGDSVTAPERPGVYFFLRGGARAGALVVNPQSAESQLRRLDLAALAARVRAADVRAVDDSAVLESGVFASAPRRPVLVPLLVIALAALLAESVVAGGGLRRSAS